MQWNLKYICHSKPKSFTVSSTAMKDINLICASWWVSAMSINNECFLEDDNSELIYCIFSVGFKICVVTINVLSICSCKIEFSQFFAETGLAARDYRANHCRLKTTKQHT